MVAYHTAVNIDGPRPFGLSGIAKVANVAGPATATDGHIGP